MKKLSVNTINMIISAVLWVLVAAGLTGVNPDETAVNITQNFIAQAWPFLMLVLTNLGTSIYYWTRTWKTDKPNFLAFLTSLPFWVVVFNIVGSVAMMWGIVIPADAGQQIAAYITNKEWWNLVGYISVNVLIPIAKKIVNTFTEKGQAKVADAVR